MWSVVGTGIAALAAVAAACAAPGGEWDAMTTASIGGSQVALTPSELSSVADVVVMGTAGEVVTEPFSANEEIPQSARGEIGYADGEYAATRIKAVEVLNGEPPENLTVAWLHSLHGNDGSTVELDGGSDVTLRAGERYVLFLVRGDGLWAGHCLALGAQGIGVVRGDLVRFGSGKTFPLDELVAQVGPPTPPAKGEGG